MGCCLFLVIAVSAAHLEEALFLIERIIQLGKGIAEFKTGHVAFEAFDREGITRFGLGKGRYVTWIIIEKGGLDEPGFEELAQHEIDQFSAGGMGIGLFSGGADGLEE